MELRPSNASSPSNRVVSFTLVTLEFTYNITKMFIKLLISFVAVFLQSSADNRDRYYVVDSDYSNGLYQPMRNQRGGAPIPFNFRDVMNVYNPPQSERVLVQLYYECLCPDCRRFDSKEFKQTVLELGPHLDVRVYPYGNAQTEEINGRVQFTCQHGPAECYGNMLHACAIDYLGNITTAILYNSCMMDESQAGKGSDDAAAEVCARSMGIDSTPIKTCARGPRGVALLKYYGIESKKANFNSVPHILINGIENSGDNFMTDVCNAFKNPPAACARANWV